MGRCCGSICVCQRERERLRGWTLTPLSRSPRHAAASAAGDRTGDEGAPPSLQGIDLPFFLSSALALCLLLSSARTVSPQSLIARGTTSLSLYIARCPSSSTLHLPCSSIVCPNVTVCLLVSALRLLFLTLRLRRDSRTRRRRTARTSTRPCLTSWTGTTAGR